MFTLFSIIKLMVSTFLLIILIKCYVTLTQHEHVMIRLLTENKTLINSLQERESEFQELRAENSGN